MKQVKMSGPHDRLGDLLNLSRMDSEQIASTVVQEAEKDATGDLCSRPSDGNSAAARGPSSSY